MNLNRVVRTVNGYKLRIYQKRFEKLKSKVESNNYIFLLDIKYREVRLEKTLDSLVALIKQVSSLGDIGKILKDEIWLFINETRKKEVEQKIEHGNFMDMINNRGRIRRPIVLTKKDKREGPYDAGPRY